MEQYNNNPRYKVSSDYLQHGNRDILTSSQIPVIHYGNFAIGTTTTTTKTTSTSTTFQGGATNTTTRRRRLFFRKKNVPTTSNTTSSGGLFSGSPALVVAVVTPPSTMLDNNNNNTMPLSMMLDSNNNNNDKTMSAVASPTNSSSSSSNIGHGDGDGGTGCCTTTAPYQVSSHCVHCATSSSTCIHLHSISAMEQYQNQSHEEIRFIQYYSNNNKNIRVDDDPVPPLVCAPVTSSYSTKNAFGVTPTTTSSTDTYVGHSTFVPPTLPSKSLFQTPPLSSSGWIGKVPPPLTPRFGSSSGSGPHIAPYQASKYVNDTVSTNIPSNSTIEQYKVQGHNELKFVDLSSSITTPVAFDGFDSTSSPFGVMNTSFGSCTVDASSAPKSTTATCFGGGSTLFSIAPASSPGSLFGIPPPLSSSGWIGKVPPPPIPRFGMSNGSGTHIAPYQASKYVNDTISTNIPSNSAIEQYKDQGHNELSFADFSSGNRELSSSTTPSALGGFDFTSAPIGVMNTSFGSSTLFCAPPARPEFDGLASSPMPSRCLFGNTSSEFAAAPSSGNSTLNAPHEASCANEMTTIMQVMEVFPDADIVAVQNMLHERMDNVIAVVDYMSIHKYPKSDAIITNRNAQTLKLSVKDESEWLYDYMSANSFVPSSQYRIDAKDLLLCDFPFLSEAGATSCLLKCHHHYAIAHNMLFEAVKGGNNLKSIDDDTQYLRVLEVSKRRPLPVEQKQDIASLLSDCRKPTTKYPVNRRKVLIMDNILQNERQYVTKKVKDWLQVHTTRRGRALKKKFAQENGTAVECACCFDSYSASDVVQCNNTIANHLFCLDCIKAYTENLIFGNGNLGIDPQTKKLALELQCFHGDGCYSGFPRTTLQKALTTKSMDKYDEIVCEINIQLAGLSNEMLCSCPKCGFQADVPTGQNIFECPVTHCQYISCRECGDAAHIPLRCYEVQRDKKKTEGRLTVEEAITRAKIRHCPSCKRSFIKESGCNKITCRCSTKVCYLCQKIIQDYTHFCQLPHCNHTTCNRCPLHSNAEEDDQRAMLAAGIAAAKDVQETIAGVDIVIDVKSIINAK